MLVKTDKDILVKYERDESNFQGKVEKLYLPENKQDLIDILKECYQTETPVTASGAGTGLTGGRVPFGGAVISFELMNKIKNIDSYKLTALVEPGLILQDFENALEEINCFYPPNPTENGSSIGGNVANNSSGARTFKYGATRNFVQALTVILSNGDELVLKRGENFVKDNVLKVTATNGNVYQTEIEPYIMPDVKHAAGYYLKNDMDVIDLFIGNEGTLGFIADITLNFIPEPEKVLGAVIFFDDMDKLFSFIDEVRSFSIIRNKIPFKEFDKITSRIIEYYDVYSLNLLRLSNNEIPETAVAAIWLEQEINSDNEDTMLEQWYDLIGEYTGLADNTWIAVNEKEHERLRGFRHSLPAQINEMFTKNNQTLVGTDTAVPVESFKDYYYFTINQIKAQHLDYVIYGHIGNCHLHSNVITKNEEDRKRAYIFYDNCINETLKLKGTISAEHGIGKIKKKYLHQMYGDKGIAEMKKIKALFDPKNLISQSTLFD